MATSLLQDLLEMDPHLATPGFLNANWLWHKGKIPMQRSAMIWSMKQAEWSGIIMIYKFRYKLPAFAAVSLCLGRLKSTDIGLRMIKCNSIFRECFAQDFKSGKIFVVLNWYRGRAIKTVVLLPVPFPSSLLPFLVYFHKEFNCVE